MSIIEELKKLIIKLNINNEDDYNNYKYKEIAIFLEEKLLYSKNKEQNAKEIIDNISILLNYTNYYNNNWLNYKIIYNNPNFTEQLANNIDSFKYKKHLDIIFDILNKNNKNGFKIEEVFTDIMLEKVIKEKLNTTTYELIFFYMNDIQKQKFLELVVKNNIEIDITYWYFKLTEENIKFVQKNILYFIKYSELFSFKELYSKDNEHNILIKKYIENNPMKLIESILEIEYNDKYNYKDIKEFTLELIKDICNNEHINISDIRRGPSGNFSRTFYIGNKVLKIGKKRGILKIPNNPYILTPLLRQEINLSGKQKFIQVTEKVDTKINDEEELYYLYKKIRELGLIWTDVKLSNVGRLLKDNIIHWKELINPTDETLNFDKKIGKGILEKGSLVIIDDDFIYKENDKNIFYPKDTLYEEFEIRYQNEKNINKLKKAKKYNSTR